MCATPPLSCFSCCSHCRHLSSGLNPCPADLCLGLAQGLHAQYQASPGGSPALGQVYRSIGLYLQNTSSQTKLLGVSSQPLQQSIKSNARARACIRGVSRTACCFHPAFSLEIGSSLRCVSGETKTTGCLCPKGEGTLQLTAVCP